ncbi:MAG: hypothetical protein V4723_14005 [Pseudomonadota bacterium]
MANREELGLIRGARGGHKAAQLELGKLYLHGSAGLPKSLPTALHWLDRAAQQGCGQACELIGTHIPAELAMKSTQPLAQWYERAFDAGVVRAGLVLAQLTLDTQPSQALDQARRDKALRALEAAARAGMPDAQWLYSRFQDNSAHQRSAAAATKTPSFPQVPGSERWARRTAANALAETQVGMLEQLWRGAQWADYLERALPVARALAAACQLQHAALVLEAEDVLLLSRCAQAALLAPQAVGEGDDIARFRELAANQHDPDAQLAMGLCAARMQVDGKRLVAGDGSANFKKAVRWLTLAGEQGMAAAWYALSRIYIKPEFSQRNVGDAQRYLERAAEMGYRDAQFECGNMAWRARREAESNDVRAAYWLQRAAAQGCMQAAAALQKVAPRHASPVHLSSAVLPLRAGLERSHPLLAARLRLAAQFRLTRAEALLLDFRAADHGHCLVVDIRASYGRSKRRLILVESAAERAALDAGLAIFEAIDCGPNGPEGNYRQRLYRLKTVVPELVGHWGEADDAEPAHDPRAGAMLECEELTAA